MGNSSSRHPSHTGYRTTATSDPGSEVMGSAMIASPPPVQLRGLVLSPHAHHRKQMIQCLQYLFQESSHQDIAIQTDPESSEDSKDSWEIPSKAPEADPSPTLTLDLTRETQEEKKKPLRQKIKEKYQKMKLERKLKKQKEEHERWQRRRELRRQRCPKFKREIVISEHDSLDLLEVLYQKEEFDFQLLILDYYPTQGLKWCQKIHQEYPECRIILLGDFHDLDEDQIRKDYQKVGASYVFHFPIEPQTLSPFLRHLVEQNHEVAIA